MFLVNFKVQQFSNNFSKTETLLYFCYNVMTNLTVDTYLRLFQQKIVLLLKNCGFLDCFLGTNVTTLICRDDQNYGQNKSNLYGCLLLTKVDNMQSNPHKQTWY